MSLPLDSKYALGIAAIIALLIAISKGSSPACPVSSLNNNRSMKENLGETIENIKQLYTLAKQNPEILGALANINAAIAKAEVVSDLLTDTEVNAMFNVDMRVLLKTLQDYQLKITNAIQEREDESSSLRFM